MDALLMPQIGENITVGTVVRWHKGEGERVEPGEVVVTVESEKASFDVEAERAGVLLEILCPEGGEAAVFSPVGYVGEPGEAGGGRRSGGGPYASPSARRVAAERGVSLEGISGTGPGGRIVKKDVLAAAPAAAPVPAGEDTVIPLEGVRKIVAERLSLSSRTIPHFYLLQDVDMGAALAFREECNRRGGAHVTVTDLVAHAAVSALKEVPGLNAHVEDERITLKARVHLGIAVASERGLVVPVVARADGKGLQTLAEEIGRAVGAARKGRLELSERGTFTVSSLGMFGVPAFLPLINPPECAILGVGAVQERVSARHGWIAVRPIMTVVLGCDHRAIDGAEAARFLGLLKQRLEHAPGLENLPGVDER